jgi:hypothetical protein
VYQLPVEAQYIGNVCFERYPFELVSAGNRGTSEGKRIWMSADQDHYSDKTVMKVVMSAESSLPLGPSGYGVKYSMNLLPEGG